MHEQLLSTRPAGSAKTSTATATRTMLRESLERRPLRTSPARATRNHAQREPSAVCTSNCQAHAHRRRPKQAWQEPQVTLLSESQLQDALATPSHAQRGLHRQALQGQQIMNAQRKPSAGRCNCNCQATPGGGCKTSPVRATRNHTQREPSAEST